MLPRAGGVAGLTRRQREVYELLAAGPLEQTAVQALAALLQARGLERGRVGVEIEGMPAGLLAEIRDALPEVEFAECANLIRLVRMVKTGEEIARMARAAAIPSSNSSRISSNSTRGVGPLGCGSAQIVGISSKPWASAPAIKPPMGVLAPRKWVRISSPRRKPWRAS